MKSDRLKINFCEQIVLTPESVVDRAAGVITNCLFLGVESLNKRDYRKAVRGAAALYDNRPIKANHPPDPKKPGQIRPIQETIGWTKNPREAADGIRGDAHVLTEMEMGRAFLEAAEKNPALFRFSHNADGEGYYEKTGKFVVESILKVRSVDVVDGEDAATTKSLFESIQIMNKKFREIIQESKAPAALKKALLEMDDAVLNADTPADAGESDARHDLTMVVAKLLKSDNADDHDLADKIRKLLKPDAPKEEKPSEKPKETATEAKNQDAQSRAERVKGLVALAGLEPKQELLESIQDMAEDRLVKHLAYLKTLVPAPVQPQVTYPRSSGPVQESRGNPNPNAPKIPEGEKLVSFLRGGTSPAMNQ